MCACLCVSKCVELNATGLQAFDLRRRFGLDFVGIKLVPKGRDHKVVQGVAKAVCSVVTGLQKTGNFIGWEQRLSIHEDEMAADTERLITYGGAVQLGRFDGGARVGHDGCGSDDAVLVSLKNGAIHACGKSKIIRIDDEPSHGSSVATVNR